MSADKEKIAQLLQKVEELTVQLNSISGELRSVSASLKSLAVGQITSPATAQTQRQPAPQTPGKERSVDDIRMSFPEELETRLGFEDKGDFIIIKP
jgi:hypothetical protein